MFHTENIFHPWRAYISLIHAQMFNLLCINHSLYSVLRTISYHVVFTDLHLNAAWMADEIMIILVEYVPERHLDLGILFFSLYGISGKTQNNACKYLHQIFTIARIWYNEQLVKLDAVPDYHIGPSIYHLFLFKRYRVDCFVILKIDAAEVCVLFSVSFILHPSDHRNAFSWVRILYHIDAMVVSSSHKMAMASLVRVPILQLR